MYKLGAHFAAIPWPLPNVWLGVSVERQQEADERVPILLDTPAAVRWISAEPLLGPIRINDIDVDGRGGPKGFHQINALTGRNTDMARPCPDVPSIDWVVVGGESGPRPMHPNWARSLRDQCLAAGVAFLFKQWGSYVPWTGAESPSPSFRFEDGVPVVRVDKRSAGRMLDGQAWDQYPGGERG
jgi:protein gp37